MKITHLDSILPDVELVCQVLPGENIRVVGAAEGQLKLVQLQVAESCPGPLGLLGLIYAALSFSLAGMVGGVIIALILTLSFWLLLLLLRLGHLLAVVLDDCRRRASVTD